MGPSGSSGVAVALAAGATKAQLDEVIAFLDSPRGESRILFFRPIRRLGGEWGSDLIESLMDDETFGREATASVRRRRR